MKYQISFKMLIVALVLSVCLVGFKSEEVSALTFSPKLFRVQQFSFNISKLKLTGIINIGFNTALFTSKISESPKVYGDCEHEYERCVGFIDQFDDTMEYLLLQAKNACIYNGESPKEKCFGLDIEAPEPVDANQPISFSEPELIQCTGPERISCNTVTGLPGTQTAKSCDTTTGEWNYGVCTAEVIVTPPTLTQCEGSQPSCPSGYTGSYICSNGQWVNECQAPVCNTNQPQCPVGSYGNYICQNGTWVSQCQQSSSCPALDPDYRVCIMSDGRYGREYTDYCNESTGEWVWRPCNVYSNLQSTCTSFTYSDWNACSNGTQGRTILTREPYGCAGGEPITYQSCCPGAEPSCPSGWTGSYTCSSGTWWNTCTPDGISSCYRGVSYKTRTSGSSDCPTCNTYAKCVGTGNVVDGKMCLLNTCSNLQPWIPFQSDSAFRTYVDSIYSQTIPNSCDPTFQYTQCQ